MSANHPNNPFYDHLTLAAHRPAHMVGLGGTYMVTAATQFKQHFFRSRKRLRFLSNTLLGVALEYGCMLDAWAVLSNHYHFIGHFKNGNASVLPDMIRKLHSNTAVYVNQLDEIEGRAVWYQYWESHLSHQTSYMPRLKYVMWNPVRHGLVDNPALYPWCSASHFESVASDQFRKSVDRFKIDRLNIYDDF